MRNDCNIVRDILPLYFENMVSEDTSKFIKEHLETCPACTAELEAMKVGKQIEKVDGKVQSQMEKDVLYAMKSLRKKFRRRVFYAAAIIVAIILACGVLLHFFPIYRIAEIGFVGRGGHSYYTNEEISKALYIGSTTDRAEAQSVLRVADQAFNDTQHTRAENEQAYGLLARYATSTDNYEEVSYNNHSLELWSAHLEETEGWIWVYYSSETFNYDGSTACGSWQIPSLWKVQKNDAGSWEVVSIKEHP